jgi:uncharacterized BrkB/YihY/UPF0761 family membrane protein
MFKLIGVLLALYTAYAAAQGEVYAKSRAWGRHIQRANEPRYFWVVIAIYALLALALLTVF